MPIIRPALYGLGLTALWLVLAWINKDTVYHIAPLLVSAVVPLGLSLSGRAEAVTAVIAAAVGATLALGATVLLWILDRLDGPSLLPSGNAITEAMVLSVAGALIGYVLAAVGRKGDDE